MGSTGRYGEQAQCPKHLAVRRRMYLYARVGYYPLQERTHTHIQPT